MFSDRRRTWLRSQAKRLFAWLLVALLSVVAVALVEGPPAVVAGLL